MKKITEFIKKNKFSIIFFLTYLVYPMILIFDWIYWLGDYGCIALVILLAVYEMLYVFRLGRKEGVSIGRAIAKGVLYLLFMPNIYWVFYYTDTFMNGYFETAFLSGDVLYEYYGFEAWKYDIYAAILFATTFVPFLIYTITYFGVSRHLKNKQKEQNRSRQ